jgi:tetratricopeptide (TPR) repeat protein
MMERTILLLAAWLSLYPVFALTPVEADTLSHRGQIAYASGEYASAILLFDSVATAYNSAGLQYNLGNCHFKLGDVPRAILHYERALRLEPGAEDVRANLDLARQQVVDRVNDLPGFALGATWSKLRGGEDVDHWARRAWWACLALFTFLAAAVFLQVRLLRQLFFGLAAFAFLATLVSIGFAAVRNAEVDNASEAIIMDPKVDVRSEPRSAGTVLFVLHKGTKVTIAKEQDTWYEVRLANGSVGWMPSTSVERI